jgi:hypothetical protein
MGVEPTTNTLQVLLKYASDVVVQGPNSLQSDETISNVGLGRSQNGETPDGQHRAHVLRMGHGVERESSDPLAWLAQTASVVHTVLSQSLVHRNVQNLTKGGKNGTKNEALHVFQWTLGTSVLKKPPKHTGILQALDEHRGTCQNVDSIATFAQTSKLRRICPNPEIIDMRNGHDSEVYQIVRGLQVRQGEVGQEVGDIKGAHLSSK